MKIIPYHRLRPDLNTEWGAYSSPYVLYQPDNYKFRQPALPSVPRSRMESTKTITAGLGLDDDSFMSSVFKFVVSAGIAGLIFYMGYVLGKKIEKKSSGKRTISRTHRSKLRKAAKRRKRVDGRFV